MLYFGYTPPTSALHILGIEKGIIPTKVRPHRKKPYEIEHVPEELGFVLAVGYEYVRRDGLPNPHHKCVEVQVNKRDRFVAPIGSIEGGVQLIPENEEIESGIFLVNNHIDLETYYYIY